MRKYLRIKKKKERRNQNIRAKMKAEQIDYTYDKVFTFKHFIEVLPKCFQDVGWKSSVQNYIINSIIKPYSDFVNMRNRELPKPVSDRDIVIYERGKARIITPIHVKDRVIQKVICDYALVPILSKKLIYDNGASLEGKGVLFTRNRIYHHLRNAIKEFGTDFYVLSFDFKNFFNSVPHRTCREMLTRYIYDQEIIDITMDMIKSHHKVKIMKIADKAERQMMLNKLENDELCGICLGSQVSQIMALVIVNDIDHYIKDVKKCKYYCRYMDDGNIFLKTKEELQELFEGMKEISDRLGLQFNETKTHITKISKGFTFLKIKYSVTNTGKIVRILTRKGTVRMRRKLKKFKPKVDSGELTLDNVYDSMQSWLAHSEIANSYITVKNMIKPYNALYGGYRITKKWKKYINGGKNGELLQVDKWADYRWGRVT